MNKSEAELVTRKIKRMEKEIALGKRKVESLEEVLKKYPYLCLAKK